MKNRALILTLLLGTLLAGSALQARAREVININRNWRFFSNSHTSDNATMVNLPHTWNRDALGGTTTTTAASATTSRISRFRPNGAASGSSSASARRATWRTSP